MFYIAISTVAIPSFCFECKQGKFIREGNLKGALGIQAKFTPFADI